MIQTISSSPIRAIFGLFLSPSGLADAIIWRCPAHFSPLFNDDHSGFPSKRSKERKSFPTWPKSGSKVPIHIAREISRFSFYDMSSTLVRCLSHSDVSFFFFFLHHPFSLMAISSRFPHRRWTPQLRNKSIDQSSCVRVDCGNLIPLGLLIAFFYFISFHFFLLKRTLC